MERELDFELKLADGKIAQWYGPDGPETARRYTASFGVEVIAWRDMRHGVFYAPLQIRVIE